MKAKISQSSLARSATALAKAIGNAPTLAGMLLTAREGTLEMRVTDGMCSTMHSCPAYVEEEGEAVVSAITLASLVKAMPDTSVTLKSDGPAVIAGYGRSKARLNGLKPEDFPAFPENQPDVTATIDAVKFKRMASIACKTTYREYDKPAYRGVMMRVSNDRLTMQATDNYRFLSLDAECRSNGDSFALVPSESIKAAMGTLGDEVTIGFSDTRLTISSGNSTMVTSLLSGSYPNIDMVMPKTMDGAASVVTDELRESLQRVEAMTKGDHRVTFTCGDDEMLVSGISPQEGEIREHVPMDSRNAFERTTLDVRFALAALEPMSDEALILFGKVGQPVVLKSYGDIDASYIVMPIR